MSGRPKRAPATPEEEREQLRQLTRELHEAAQAARDAARELRGQRHQIAEDLATQFRPVIAQFQEQLQKFTNHQIDLLSKDIRDIERHIQQAFAELMHAATPEQLMDMIIEQTKNVVLGELRSITGQQHAASGQVLVGTQEQLDSFLANGGDPGIVLDARG
jgi:hypothetical protein